MVAFEILNPSFLIYERFSHQFEPIKKDWFAKITTRLLMRVQD